MTDGVYPFSRANASDFTTGQTLTHTHVTTLDKNAAAGADGSLWTDIAIAQNWIGSETQANYGHAILWSDVNEQWFSFGVNAGNPLVANRNIGSAAFATSGTVDAGAGLTPRCAVEGPSIMVMGGTPGSASTSKLRSATTGSAWTARTTNASGTEGVRCLGYHTGTTQFVAGLDNTAATNMEYSTNGTSWTQITGLPNTNPRGAFASNGSIMVVMPYNTSTNKCITATTASGTWTERTLPATQIWHGVHWSPTYSLFIALGASSLAYSADGITWSAVTGAPSVTPAGSVMLGRTMVWGYTGTGNTIRIGRVVSAVFSEAQVINLGANTPRGFGVANSSTGLKQIMIADSAGIHRWTVAGGSLL